MSTETVLPAVAYWNAYVLEACSETSISNILHKDMHSAEYDEIFGLIF